MQIEIHFSGHKNIRALHKNTIEVTTESELTVNGDCIIGVNATYGCSQIPDKIKNKLRNPNSKIKFSIIVNSETFTVSGNGSGKLELTHPHDIVLRKSDFICPRTIAINCDRASDTMPRKMVRRLQNPKTKGVLKIEVT